MSKYICGRKLTVIFFLFFLPNCLFGQSNNKTINGKVVDNNTSPVSFAYVYLLTEKDSLPIKTIMTDNNGDFEFNGIGNQKLLIRTHCLGFNDNVMSIKNGLIYYNIVLSQSMKAMDEVVISGRSSISPIQFKPEKTVISISFFSEARKLIILASSLMPSLRLIGWDVGIGTSGPVLIEGNSDYDITGSALMYGGYRSNPVFKRVLKEINFK